MDFVSIGIRTAAARMATDHAELDPNAASVLLETDLVPAVDVALDAGAFIADHLFYSHLVILAFSADDPLRFRAALRFSAGLNPT